MDRFIPAGAGNTVAFLRNTLPEPVYPRWRGEHLCVFLPGRSDRGLSPLARGTQVPPEEVSVALRFIPAGAGNTDDGLRAVRFRAVYPRWRGEHGKSGSHNCADGGLSPLARGTPLRTLAGSSQFRFIPAGAGNTV